MEQIMETTLAELHKNRPVAERRALDDSELEKVTGGEFFQNQLWDDPKKVVPRFHVGDKVEVTSGWGFGTVHCTVKEVLMTRVLDVNNGNAYMAVYKVEADDPSWYAFSGGIVTLSEIEIPGTTGSFYF